MSTPRPYNTGDVELVEQAIRNVSPTVVDGYVDGRDLLTAEACAVLEALAAAGRLLPTDSTGRTEHEIDWTAGHGKPGTESITYWDLDDAQLAKETDAARLFGCGMLRHRRRTHRTWPDGSVLIGPWTTVEDEETP